MYFVVMYEGKCSETQTIIRRHLLRAYARFISLSSLLTGDSHYAEDLMQETFYRMLVHIDYYKGEEIRPWLFTIAYNAFIDWYRKERNIKQQKLQNSIYQTFQVQNMHIS